MTQHTTASRRRELRRKLVQTVRQIGVAGGTEPLENFDGLIKIPPEYWTPEPSVVQNDSRRLDLSIVPDGLLVKKHCAACYGKSSVLYRPGRITTELEEMKQMLEADASSLKDWCKRHEQCHKNALPSRPTGPVTNAVNILRQTANSHLERGRSFGPLMVALSDGSKPLQLDISPVLDASSDERLIRIHRFTAAVRGYSRLAHEELHTVVTVRRSYASLYGNLSELDKELPGFRLAASDDCGQRETAVFRVETASSLFTMVAPVVRRSGIAGVGRGCLGPAKDSPGMAFLNLDGFIAGQVEASAS